MNTNNADEIKEKEEEKKEEEKKEEEEKEEEWKKKEEKNIIIKYGFIPNILSRLGFEHIVADEDGLYNGLILPKSHSNYLFCTSCLSLVSGLFGLYKKQYKFVIYPLSVFVASVNYWRHPVNNWRRRIDQTFATFSIISQTINAIGMPNYNPYLITMSSATICYPLGYYFQHKYLPMSTFCHSLIHIVANVSNFILYSGSNNDTSSSNIIV